MNERIETGDIEGTARGDSQTGLLAATDVARKRPQPGIGATEELSLRISTAVLTLTHFTNPGDGREMLVFERKCSAQVDEAGAKKKLTLNTQPIGGASRLNAPERLWEVTGGFNYDTQKSADESDFRVQIRPGDWERVRDFSREHFSNPGSGVIECDINREFAEELEEALGVAPGASSYRTTHVGIAVQEDAAGSARLDVAGASTKRVFSVHDVEITDPALIAAILENSASVSNVALETQALDAARASTKKQAKATALIALPRPEVEAALAETTGDVALAGNKLIETVRVVLAKPS